MRPLLAILLAIGFLHGAAQYDRFSFRYNYAFIEDGPTLTPLKGTYRVEYIGRGQYGFSSLVLCAPHQTNGDQ
ncbi:MAG: hypothetical protein JNL52_05790 [Flavobacteriales bacterium]|nr:hypothetical protein [Flavobacteriales bacterium]